MVLRPPLWSILRSYSQCGGSALAFSPENTSQKSWYSWGTPFNGSSCCAVNAALTSSQSRLVQCGLGTCWVPLGDSRKVVLPASWQILSMVLLLTSLMSITLGASLGTSGSVFHVSRLWNMIFISTQSMLGLCWVSQS